MAKRLAKTFSTRHAMELVRLGWTADYQFFSGDDDEPYEIGLCWEGEGDPVRASENADEWIAPKGVLRLESRRKVRRQHTPR